MADFLLEIGCEEIPARMLDAAEAELRRRVSELLARERLDLGSEASVGYESFSTPRRLAVLARGLAAGQPDLEEEVMGPAVKIAYKDGAPTAAAQAFAKKVGVPLEHLERKTTAKGEYLSAKVTRKGSDAAQVLAQALPDEIAQLSWPKTMYWRGKNSERFIRPVRWLVAMVDDAVVPVEFAGVQAGSRSRGHRILATGQVDVSPAGYREAMRSARVVASAAEREQEIRKALDAAARTIPGARWREDADLLRTVVNLTESPSVILGSFQREYLMLPEEVIVTVMRDHQKYFALDDASGKLLPNFLAVLNIDRDPEGIIQHGNERVLRARLADARFFWEADQKTPLKARTELLRSVTFQKDLGSYRGKAGRVAMLADKIAEELERRGVKSDRAALREAAFLAKTDLTTELVKEFTELQGIVGGLYARAQGLPETVAAAIYDHYKPESMEDQLPKTIEGAILSIADKADSVAGMFALGLVPSGSKDPFALRRQANGIVRVIAHHGWPLRFGALVAMAFESYVEQGALIYSDSPATAHDAVHDFLRERLEFYLQEVKGFAYDVVNAVLAAGADDVPDAVHRAEAVSQVRGSEDFAAIGTSFKRMKNILRQAREAGKPAADHLEAKKLKEPEEKDLAAQLKKVGAEVEKLRAAGDYAGALHKMAVLRPPIDAFFDKVMVMVDDEELRSQRLALLQELLNRFTTIADFSEVVTAG